MSESFLERALHLMPFWSLALAVFSGTAIASWVGWWLRQRQTRAGEAEAEDTNQENYVVSAVMGLLALLIGFTFSLAIDRLDTRRERVLMEANAIETTYLRSQLLDEPHRTRISGLLVQYTDLSIALANTEPGPRQRALLERNQALITDLWAETVAAFPSVKPFDFSSSYLESMNGLIELNAARQQARRARVPAEIFLALFLYQLIAAGVIGYVLVGRGSRRAGALLLLLFGISLVLVIDVDDPYGGGIATSQEPLLRLKASLETWPPAKFERFDDASSEEGGQRDTRPATSPLVRSTHPQ